MQGPETQNTNVINLFTARKNAEKPNAEVAETASEDSEEMIDEEQLSFREIMARNEQNRIRMKKERETANKSVLRSYRIKH